MAIYYEEVDLSDKSFVCVVAVKTADADNETYKKVAETFCSDATKQLFDEKYKGFFYPRLGCRIGASARKRRHSMEWLKEIIPDSSRVVTESIDEKYLSDTLWPSEGKSRRAGVRPEHRGSQPHPANGS